VVPDFDLPTWKARAVLPDSYSRADAVFNVQRAALLMAALAAGESSAFPAALEDKFHQPYRAALCPLLPCLQELKGKEGILGAVLSGAGPSVLIFLDPRSNAERIRKLVAAQISRNGLSAELLETSISLRGGRSKS
jgi:homoserine kinase